MGFMRGLTGFSAAIAIAALTAGAFSLRAAAADPSFALGSRVGLVTPPGLAPAKTFSGFEDVEKGVKVVAAELPEGAYAAVETALTQKNQPPGKRPEKFETALGPAYLSRETAQLSGESAEQFAMMARAGKATAFVTVQVPKSAAATYSEAAVKQMLASIALRPEVPVSEQLSLLPFELKSLGNFKTVRTLAPGQTILLTDGEGDDTLDNPVSIIISVARGGPAAQDDRDRFARQLMDGLPGLKSGRVTNSEPMRIGGSQGYETRMEAVMAKGDADITLVQWLRFGAGAYIRMIGMAPKEKWAEVFPRLRAVRDGIEPK